MKPNKTMEDDDSPTLRGEVFDFHQHVASKKYFELVRFPEEQREKVKEVLDGKEVLNKLSDCFAVNCHFEVGTL